MPYDDWQFWVVTLLAIGGLAMVIRPLLPRRKDDPRCGSCPTGSAASDPSVGKKTTLTIEGRRVG